MINLRFFGVARDFADAELKQIMRLLISKGILANNGSEYPTISVTPVGRAALDRREAITLQRPKEKN